MTSFQSDVPSADYKAVAPIPDAPGPPWVLGLAEYGGRYVRLLDFEALRDLCTCGAIFGPPLSARFTIGAGLPQPSDHEESCPVDEPFALWCVAHTDSEAEALTEYHRQAELLRHRDGGGEGE